MMERARAPAAAFALALIAACQGAAEPNKARAAAYLETFLVQQDWAQWPAYFAADASLNGSDFALQIMRGTAEGLAFSFADLELEVEQQVEEGDRVVTTFVVRGRHVQPFNSQPASGRIVALDGFVIDRFSDGRVVESTMTLDIWGLSRRVASGAAGIAPAN